jgi:hypothetical protein
MARGFIEIRGTKNRFSSGLVRGGLLTLWSAEGFSQNIHSSWRFSWRYLVYLLCRDY